MPGEGSHQGEGLEEESVVEQQQAECGQVASGLSPVIQCDVMETA